MAQKTEKEETEFKVVVSESSLSLCINNCGFTGTPATKNMCQKCYNATSSSSVGLTTTAHKFSGEKAVRSTPSLISDRTDLVPETSSALEIPDRTETVKSEESTGPVTSRTVNRCSGCRRKVGLTGFRCRCGDLYCSEHRYSDRHECSYDYKAAGREAIERENPVVKAAKIIKV